MPQMLTKVSILLYGILSTLEGIKEIRKSLQAKIYQLLNEIVAELKKGMGNGTLIIRHLLKSEAIRRLDALTPALEKIDPGELSITEGLSEEGFEVYRKLRGQLEGAEKQARRNTLRSIMRVVLA